ncbi:MAG: EamA family transporter, partial [Rhodospirillales bacterium]|nr:EamA family transporter [Rhodospirillales bacterium]
CMGVVVVGWPVTCPISCTILTGFTDWIVWPPRPLGWFWAVRHYPAARLSSFTFLTPLFGVIFGGWLLGEPLSPALLMALLLVGIGIYVVNKPEKMAAA